MRTRIGVQRALCSNSSRSFFNCKPHAAAAAVTRQPDEALAYIDEAYHRIDGHNGLHVRLVVIDEGWWRRRRLIESNERFLYRTKRLDGRRIKYIEADRVDDRECRRLRVERRIEAALDAAHIGAEFDKSTYNVPCLHACM